MKRPRQSFLQPDHKNDFAPLESEPLKTGTSRQGCRKDRLGSPDNTWSTGSRRRDDWHSKPPVHTLWGVHMGAASALGEDPRGRWWKPRFSNKDPVV